MCSKCPRLNCVYVEFKWLGQRQKYTTVKKKKGISIVGVSNELNGEKQAVVQRSLTVLSQKSRR